MNTKAYFTVFLLLFAIGIHAQDPAIPGKQPLELQVMLLDNIKDMPLPPYCGIHMTDNVVNFKVMKSIHGLYLESTVKIHIHCLRELVENKSINNHVTYVYKLKPVNPETTPKDKLTYEIIL